MGVPTRVRRSAARAVRWTDDAGAGQTPLRPGEFFIQLKCHVPLGALLDSRVNGGETTFRLFAPRARAVRLHIGNNLKKLDEAVTYDMDRRSDGAWARQTRTQATSATCKV